MIGCNINGALLSTLKKIDCDKKFWRFFSRDFFKKIETMLLSTLKKIDCVKKFWRFFSRDF